MDRDSNEFGRELDAVAVVGFESPPAEVLLRPKTSAAEGHSPLSSSEKPADPPMTLVDKMIMISVVIGIVVFAAFQIRESVNAHNNPASESSTESPPRVFPAVMICPFSYDNTNAFITGKGVCPQWSPQAILSFRQSLKDEKMSTFSAFNINADVASDRRSQSICAKNLFSVSKLNDDPFFDFNLHFNTDGDEFATDDISRYTRLVNVKNTALPRNNIQCPDTRKRRPDSRPFCTSTQTSKDDCATPCNYTRLTELNVPLLCNSFTPPIVQCVAFDPLHFDKMASAVPGFNSKCNPMREVRPNSVDAFRLNLRYEHLEYSYSGLERISHLPRAEDPSHPPPTPVVPFQNLPSSLKYPPPRFYSKMGIITQTKGDLLLIRNDPGQNLTDSIFGGLMAVFYDPFEGPPDGIDFDRSRFDEITSGSVLGSTVLLRTQCDQADGPKPRICEQIISAPMSIKVTSRVERNLQKVNKTRYGITIQPSVLQPSTLGRSAPPDFVLTMSFDSDVSVVTTQVVTLTVLTTISIIVSTAATLWGSQTKIKEGITWLLEYAEKRKKGLKTAPPS